VFIKEINDFKENQSSNFSKMVVTKFEC